jgi:hypothetical protein
VKANEIHKDNWVYNSKIILEINAKKAKYIYFGSYESKTQPWNTISVSNGMSIFTDNLKLQNT